MHSQPLPFTTADTDLIQSGVDRRNRSIGNGDAAQPSSAPSPRVSGDHSEGGIFQGLI
jgi:hypothetical protein